MAERDLSVPPHERRGLPAGAVALSQSHHAGHALLIEVGARVAVELDNERGHCLPVTPFCVDPWTCAENVIVARALGQRQRVGDQPSRAGAGRQAINGDDT